MAKKNEDVIGVVVGLGALVALGLTTLVIKPDIIPSKSAATSGCGCSAGKH